MDTFVVGPNARLSRDEGSGTLTVTVGLARCTSSSHRLVNDTVKAWFTPGLYGVEITGAFTFARHPGPVKKDCSGHIKRVFVFENTATGGYRFINNMPAERPYGFIAGKLRSTGQVPQGEGPRCATPPAGEASGIDLNGNWIVERAPDEVYIIRSGEPGFLAYRPAGLLGGGGVVPSFAEADLDGVFALYGVGPVRFVSSSCAEILAPDGSISVLMVRHDGRSARKGKL